MLNRTRYFHIAVVACLAVALMQCRRERPSTATTFAERALAHPLFVWDSITAPGFTLYTKRGGYGAERALEYRDEVTSALSHALTMLNEPRFPEHVRVFVVESREDVDALTGAPTNGWADPAGRNLAVVARAECRPLFRHEVMHVVSLLLWGNPLGGSVDPRVQQNPVTFEQGAWLREGIAAAAEDRYGAYSYRGMAAQWQSEGGLIALDTLVRSFYRQDDLAAYLQSGSLVQYLLETYGTAPLRVVWREGADAFGRAFGKSLPQIEADWQQWLRATPLSLRPRSIAVARTEDRCPRRPR